MLISTIWIHGFSWFQKILKGIYYLWISLHGKVVNHITRGTSLNKLIGFGIPYVPKGTPVCIKCYLYSIEPNIGHPQFHFLFNFQDIFYFEPLLLKKSYIISWLDTARILLCFCNLYDVQIEIVEIEMLLKNNSHLAT